jgi:hypothetical protein
MARDDLAPRYAPGEDILPLVRGSLGGLMGVALALAVDWLLPVPGLPRLVWPALWASVAGAGMGATGVGVAVLVALGVLAALAFVYGQFRRFVPGRPVVPGIAWGLLLWLLALPALAPRAVAWLASAGAPEPDLAVRAAAGLVLETVLSLAVYGAAVGVVNPARRS